MKAYKHISMFLVLLLIISNTMSALIDVTLLKSWPLVVLLLANIFALAWAAPLVWSFPIERFYQEKEMEELKRRYHALDSELNKAIMIVKNQVVENIVDKIIAKKL